MKYFFRHILIFAFVFFSLSGYSQTAKDLNKQKANTEKEIANIDKKLGETTKAKQTKTEQIKLLNQRIEQRKKLIANTDIQISITENEINKKNKKINEIRLKLVQFKEAFSELVVNVYINRKKATWLMYVFASEDISQAYRRLKYLQSYADAVLIQAKKIEETTQGLGKEIVLLADKKQELGNYKSERKKELERLAKDETDATKMLEGLKKEETSLVKELQKKRLLLEKVNKEIENILNKEIAKSKSTGYTKTPENIKLSNDFAANRGHLPWPVKQGNVVGFFGNHSHPVFKHIALPPNNGIDIETPVGENVLAAFDGTVSNVFPMGGMNICILLKHGDYFTLYCNLGRASVKVGDNVKTGTVLGKLVAGKDDSQLHFELWKGITKLDPQMWLAKR
jgi:septal ring factor EnvC (AmiA/AmiB activator)